MPLQPLLCRAVPRAGLVPPAPARSLQNPHWGLSHPLQGICDAPSLFLCLRCPWGRLRTESSSSGPLCHASSSASSPPSCAASFARAAPCPAAGSSPEGDEQSRAGGLLLFHSTQPSVPRVFLGKGQAGMHQFLVQNTQGKELRQRASCWEVPAGRAQSPPQDKVTPKPQRPRRKEAATQKPITDCF